MKKIVLAFIVLIALIVFVGVIIQTPSSTLTKLTNKIWVYKFDDDKEKPRVEFKYSTSEEEVHYISDKWNTIEKASYYLSNTIDKVFDDTKVGKISDGKYIILKDVFEDGHIEVSCLEIIELTTTTFKCRDIEGDEYSDPITLYGK